MQPSAWLYSFLEQWERFRPTAYLPTPQDVPTIGYGHTRGVALGDTCTQGQAQDYLRSDVEWAADAVNSMARAPLSQQQYDALCSFVFNVGAHNFGSSHLLGYLNVGDFKSAVAEFPKWNRQGNKVLLGLTERRIAEAKHFEGVP